MVFQDKVLVCRDCQNEFLFSAGEQAFYAEKGFSHDPTRCRACRAVRKGRPGPGPDRPASRGLHPAICTDCGRETEVPFRPSPGKPVYCRECFQRRGARPASRIAASPVSPQGAGSVPEANPAGAFRRRRRWTPAVPGETPR